MTSFAVASIGAKNAPQSTGAAPAQLPPSSAPSSNIGVGVQPNLNTIVDDEGIFELDDLFAGSRILSIFKLL
ncbi:hypothetical protein HAX54_025692 [Datura stramonium]|uniref:Uncharacterized protein n=1 Tax=Datura stramonium TaxID=4076 RepID=A0ABS8V2B7_DATST|nr:hypothetical protein [Datura stramonium]